jgi:hypothetical protein
MRFLSVFVSSVFALDALPAADPCSDAVPPWSAYIAPIGIAAAWGHEPMCGRMDNQQPPPTFSRTRSMQNLHPEVQMGNEFSSNYNGGIARVWSRQPQAGSGVTGQVQDRQPPNFDLRALPADSNQPVAAPASGRHTSTASRYG